MDFESLAKSDSEKGNYVRGWASTPDLDNQGDIVDPKGIEIDDFITNGYINYEHNPNKIIGVPTTNCYVDPDKGLYIEAKLFMDRPEAQKMWELAMSLKKNGVQRPLGFSIEGDVLYRDHENQSIVRGVRITGLALTANPANRKATWETLVKSMVAGNEVNPENMQGGEALRRQSLADSLVVLTYGLKDMNFADYRDFAKELDKMGNFNDDIAVTLMQLCYGYSKLEAQRIVKSNNEVKGEDK